MRRECSSKSPVAAPVLASYSARTKDGALRHLVTEKKFDCTISQKAGTVKIHIAGFLHVAFRRRDLLAVQSWMDKQARVPYCLEFLFRGGAILLVEYDTFEKWTSVLKLLDSQKLLLK